MDNRSAEVLVLWYVTAVVTLLVLWFLGRMQAAGGPRFVLLGCVLALAALCYGLLGSVTDSHGQPLPLPPTGLAETVLRLSAVLVLGGIAIVLLSREPARAIVTTPEAPSNVPPSV